MVAGVRVTSLVRTAADLARRAASDTEAVVALDVLLGPSSVTRASVTSWREW